MENTITVHEDELKRLVIRLHGFFQNDDTPELLAYMAMTSLCKALEEKNGYGCKSADGKVPDTSHQGTFPKEGK